MFNAHIPTLTWIISASLLGGVLSVMCAGFVALNARTQWIPMLISYAIGAMLGAVFLEILPHAFHEASSVENMAATVLFGILLFFVLEKLVLWRHCHGEHCEAHAMHTEDDCPAYGEPSKFKAVTSKTPSISKPHAHGHHHDSGRSGMMIMVGDTFHNFVDGILIAAAFMIDVRLGAVTAMAIIAHEIPQEVGDFLILLHSGYSKKQALLFNLFSSLATVVGGVLAYFALQTVQNWIATILGLAAASMLYVAVADLIPGLHKRTELKATIAQVGLIGLGIGSIWLTKFFLE
ncbi:MAG: ZIP family metal transporter [Candidatus Methylopumilus sp.]|jgi:zinc and cadmium transporter